MVPSHLFMTSDKQTHSASPSVSGNTRWKAAAVVAVGASLLLSGVTSGGSAHAADGKQSGKDNSIAVQEQITASATAVVAFEQPKVTTSDMHPKKPASINVQSAVKATKRPMAGTLFSPLEVAQVTSKFGLRVSPISGAPDDNHLGQDYGSPCGTPVYAADSGTVTFSGWHEYGGGNRVDVDHGNGLKTSYNHMESNAVKVGDVVDVGAVVGAVGTTGASTGCHLHFETIDAERKWVDPAGWQYLPIVK